ncbi:MAG: hypothetical protein WD768_05560 [Phycisphaeraceae bacterium]
MKQLPLTFLLGCMLAGPVQMVQAADRDADRSGFTDDDFAAHVAALKKRLPSDDFTIIIEKPFVVIGDEKADVVKLRAIQTVRWAAKRLKERYFDKDPHHILDVWLFKDKTSYEKHVDQLWNTKPTTPYGYYSSHHRALVMNISTGGGTLVHEIVHPFIESNFPRCPAWLNEGLGSLYEQCADRNDIITGLTNWRLAGLQKAIKAETVPSFKDLCGSNSIAFYSRDRGTNYAQARYLCMYLQEKGLLQKFYKDFKEQHAKDPGGYDTLKAVLKADDMEAFQKEWEAWVMKLKFP